MRIVMVGAGYVGLVSGACFAELGHEVTCVDTDRDKVASLNGGRLPIYEPGLDVLIPRNIRARRLAFSTELAGRVHDADAVFIAVGTPSRRCDGHADLSSVFAAVRTIAVALPQNALVVIKSTVPVGTGDEVERRIAEQRPNLAFDVASNPEFLRAGAAVRDFQHPDRVVIGVQSDAARGKMGQIYRALALNPARLLYTSRRSAELIKYAANTFLATKIAFINEISDLCERVGADVQDVSRGMGLDARIGPKFLKAGPGFGGSCFPKDALALAKMAEDNEIPMRIVEGVLAANQARKRMMVRKIAAAIDGPLRGKTIALLGLTFKPNTDDLRESPAIALAMALEDMGAVIRAYDPAGMKQAAAFLPRSVSYCRSPYHAAEGAEALVVVTEWQQFRSLNFARLKRVMRAPLVVDLRNLYCAEEMTDRGFRYRRIGAPMLAPVTPAPVTSSLRPVAPLPAAESAERRRPTATVRAKRRRSHALTGTKREAVSATS